MTDDADDRPDDGPDDAPGAAGPEGEPRKRRRRRRRRPGDADASPVGAEPAVPVDAGPAAPNVARAPTVAHEGGRARREWSSRAPRPAADQAPSDATVPTAQVEGGAPSDGAPLEGAAGATEGAPTEGRRARRRRGERGDRGPDTSGRNQGAPNASGPSPGARTDGGRGGGGRSDGGRPNDGRGGGRSDGGRPNDGRGGGRRDGRSGGGRDGGRPDAARDPRYDARLDAKADATDDWAPSEDAASTASAAPAEPKMARLEQKVRGSVETPNPDDDAPEATEAGVPWGTDDPGPAPEVTLAADLPPNIDGDDDPATADLAEAGNLPVADEVANFASVRFAPGGRVQWFDASEADYAVGDRVVVDAERGTKLGWIAMAPTRRSTRGFDQSRGPRRIVRKAHEGDLKHEREGDDQKARALRLAKDAAAALRLPLKVFRVEVMSGKVNVYYTCDEMRMDMRAFVQNLTRELGGNPRIELRQLGVRDEAKAVGGIGTCGLTLCCTTWLPDFVPVSIKMAKDQGLVLSPSKVSGQCGRLKCCLVYEQANYAEMRKGLPKLGKRVVSARGEGRVVEVDVLHQRLRVSYGHGDSEVLPATDVKPLFPPGTQPPREPRPERAERGDRPARGDRNDRGPRPPRPEPGGEVSPEAAIAAQAAEDTDDADHDEDVPPDPSRDPSQYDEPDEESADFPDPSRDPNAPDDDDL